MTLAEKIKLMRENKKMTQKDVAALMGISQQAYGQYETGNRAPKFETLKKIADALGCKPYDLYPDEKRADAIKFYMLSELNHAQPSETGFEYSHMVAHEQENELNWYVHQQELVDSINESFSQLNDAGQEEAAKRVKELTLLPQYQRPQDAPTDTDDKTPAEK